MRGKHQGSVNCVYILPSLPLSPFARDRIGPTLLGGMVEFTCSGAKVELGPRTLDSDIGAKPPHL